MKPRYKVRTRQIKLLLAENNLSQSQLATNLKLTQQYLSNVINGHRFVGPQMRERLLKALKPYGATFEKLFIES